MDVAMTGGIVYEEKQIVTVAGHCGVHQRVGGTPYQGGIVYPRCREAGSHVMMLCGMRKLGAHTLVEFGES